MNNVNDLLVLLICDLSASFVYLCTVGSFHLINVMATPENPRGPLTRAHCFMRSDLRGLRDELPRSPLDLDFGPHKEIPVETPSKVRARITPK